MARRKHLTAVLTAIGISTSLSGNVSGAPEAPANFRIMNAQEITAHTAAMKNLQGSAREEYRNTHYRELQERARRQGYQMPAAPPWAARTAGTTAQANPLPTMPIAPAPVDAPGPAPRIDIPAPRAAGDIQPGTSADASDAMTAYREAMRSRFDAFMRDRQAQYEEEDLRRQREQMAAARRQNDSTQQPPPRDTFQPPRYPGMPVWAPPYPMAFPGYREPYPEQR